MQRITIAIDDDLLDAVDALMRQRLYSSRSEAFRDILRERLGRDASAEPATPCVATLSYVYDHETRELAQRLIAAQHDRHDLTVASMHVHLDHGACLEVAVLRGTSADIKVFADSVTTQRGVRHGSLHLVPVTVTPPHRHGDDDSPHTHLRA